MSTIRDKRLSEEHLSEQRWNGESRPLGALMLDLAGTSISESESRLIQDPQVGGIILFARNYDNLSQLQELTRAVRRVRPDILLAVDQEGGRVQRFRRDFTLLPPMSAFCESYRREPQQTLELVADTGWLMAVEVISAGVDLSFAPVLDVDDNFCSVISDRSFSAVPEEVIALAGAFISGMHDAGMVATGKHFPGHGSVREDSHEALPIDGRSMAAVEAGDMQPFLRLQSQLDAIMPAHIRFVKIDSKPVGFSRYWLQDIVRQKMQFEGVIFSDDLTMSATESYGDYARRAELALSAGCDMVLVCNNSGGAGDVLEYLRRQSRPLSPRLGRLRARKTWSRAELENMPRWQRTHERLTAVRDKSD